jgi:hypothetical protein
MTSELKLDESSDALVVQGGMKVAFNAGGIIVNVRRTTITVDKNGTVAMQIAANDTSLKATPEISTIESTGDHKDEIYEDTGLTLMDHYAAAARQGSTLPRPKLRIADSIHPEMKI